MISVRSVLLVVALVMFGACGPCGGSSASSGDGCAHPGICLTLTGPLAGATNGLVLAPDCIPGGGLDVVFTTNVAGHETNIEILVTDDTPRQALDFTRGRSASSRARRWSGALPTHPCS